MRKRRAKNGVECQLPCPSPELRQRLCRSPAGRVEISLHSSDGFLELFDLRLVSAAGILRRSLGEGLDPFAGFTLDDEVQVRFSPLDGFPLPPKFALVLL